MALFKSKEMAAPQAAATPREKVEVAPGVYTAECMKIGQLLVEGDQMSHDNLATALQLSNGDPMQFAELALARFGAGRQELAVAIAEVWGVEPADTRAVELNPEIAKLLPENIARPFRRGPPGAGSGDCRGLGR